MTEQQKEQVELKQGNSLQRLRKWLFLRTYKGTKLHDAYITYAETLKTNPAALTKEQKQQALLNNLYTTEEQEI